MNILHVKSIKLTHILCLVVVSGDFCRFKLALTSLSFLSKDEVKAAHSGFDRCPRGGRLRLENPTDRHFSQPYLTIVSRSTFHVLDSFNPEICYNCARGNFRKRS